MEEAELSMRDDKEADQLSLRAVAPGLILILLVDILTLCGFWPQQGWINHLLSLTLLSLPWVTLIVLRKPVRCLGYQRKDFLRIFGWGIVAGGFWRLLSIIFNLWWVNLGGLDVAWISRIVGALIWIPLIEETFFRGYLLRPLMTGIGVWPGILFQALFFTIQPVHWNQGGLALLSIFGFGLLAGWLQQHWDSIWPSWGAHAFANLLPMIVLFA